MNEINAEPLIEDIMIDTLIYTRLFNRELDLLGEREFIKRFLWLILIDQYNNPSISELGKILKVSKSQMTLKMDKGVEAGFIERVPDKEDRRIIRINLTDKGKNYIISSQKTIKESMNQLLTPLNAKEIEELKNSIKIIKKVVLKIQQSQDIDLRLIWEVFNENHR